jgi:hypothetical protein
MHQPSIQLVIETSDGTFIRSVRPATMLPEGPTGYDAEDATRHSAASWGLPDFVFRSTRRLRGSATREIGDAILVVGSGAASVQVKARLSPTSNETRERSWLDKNIRQAASQGRGTIKSLTAGAPVTLTNERGRQLVIDGAHKTWLVVVVLDHPGVDGYVPPKEESAVVLLRRDWDFLFEQLKSTYAVLEYLQRVSTRDPVALGEEPLRYYRLAAADASVKPHELDPRIAHFASPWAVPLLPQAPAGHGEFRNHSVLRAVLEDVATVRLPEGFSHTDMLEVLAAIDAAPVANRSELGRLWLTWLREVADVPGDEMVWRFRNFFGNERPYLIFAAAPRYATWVQEAFSWLVSFRHQEHIEVMPERSGLMTVGILLTPRTDQFGPWDTTVIAVHGDQQLTPEDRAVLEQLWGKLGERIIRV